MKHFGFTLGEVLVVLGLIGTIAALTLPTFVVSSQNQQYGTRLSATITEVENAFQRMLNDEEADNLTETAFASELNKSNNSDNIAKEIIPYLNIEKYAAKAKDLNSSYTGSFQSIKKGAGTVIAANLRSVVQLKSGAIVYFHCNGFSNLNEAKVLAAGGSNNQKISLVYIDVNGISKPNTYGRDVFKFVLGGDGILYPLGSKTAYILEQSTVKATTVAENTWDKSTNKSYACSGTEPYYGTGCTARLIENNFKMDY